MHRSKKTSSQRIWSKWGDWIWSQTHHRWYSQRQDTHGEIETRWGPVCDDDKQIPRGGGDRQEDLVETLQGVHLRDGEDEEYQDDRPYSVSSPFYPSSTHRRVPRSVRTNSHTASYQFSQPGRKGHTATYSQGTSSTGGRKRADRKGKGRSYYDSEDEDYHPDDDHGHVAQGQEDPEAAEGEQYLHRGKSTQRFSPPSTRPPYGNPAGPYPGDAEVDDDGYATAVPDRTGYNPGTSSSSHVDPSYEEEQLDSYQAGMTGDYIRGVENELDLDPRYRIEPSYKFQPGEVFKVLWPEPAGGTSGKAPSLSDKKEVRDNYGGSIFVGFRRFIVVANDSGHCTCVPISTYGTKGCKKRGIKPEKHGIITEKGVKSKRLDGEPKLGFPTVRMKIQVDGERLARESRVNYSKIVTVEHNVKVFFIGTIYGDDYDLVVDAVNSCWEAKNFFKRKH